MNKQSKTKGISWTDKTWNPIVGCKQISKVCSKCWAQTFARRMSVNSRTPFYHGLITDGQWNGQSRFIEQRLYEPLRLKEPSRIATILMGDPFLNPSNFPYLDKVLTVVKMCPQHTFIFLTRRSAIAGIYFRRPYVRNIIGFPLPNLWLGVSAEDDKSLKQRAPGILEIGASVTFLSLEPTLGDVPSLPDFLQGDQKFDLVIMGGQKGIGSDPLPIFIPRYVRDACVKYGVKFHFKQWGSYLPEVEYVARFGPGKRAKRIKFGDEFYYHMSAEKAGKTLDGREWLELPESVR